MNGNVLQARWGEGPAVIGFEITIRETEDFMKILDKFRNKYSFNFLGISGWVVCILFFKCFFPYRNEDQLSFPLMIIFTIIASFAAFCLSLSIIIFERELIKKLVLKIGKNSYKFCFV